MSEKASIKVERRSTFDFDKHEEEENCYILISGKGKFGGEVFFCSGSECGFYRKNKGQD